MGRPNHLLKHSGLRVAFGALRPEPLLSWVLGLAAMSLAACGPAPYVEDARSAQGACAAPAAPAEAAGAGTVIVVQCPGPVAAAPQPPPIAAPPPLPAPAFDPLVALAFQRRMPKFMKCYRKGLRDNPWLAGTVNVRLLLDDDGDVDDAVDNGSTLPDREVIECVLDEAESLHFKHFVEGTVIYPLTFHPGMAG